MRQLGYGARWLAAFILDILLGIVVLVIGGPIAALHWFFDRSPPGWLQTLRTIVIWWGLFWLVHLFSKWGMTPQAPRP